MTSSASEPDGSLPIEFKTRYDSTQQGAVPPFMDGPKIPNMLTFIHLSDIHFAAGDDGSQFDLNQHIRRALLTDLPTRPAAGAAYDGLLITGDIAYSGKPLEYEITKTFLSEVYAATGLSMNETYMVPGNHDVNRDHVQPTFPLWESHAAIRAAANPVHWRATIQTQLQKDPSKLLLVTLHGYNGFAQGCGCQTTADNLAWSLDFPKPAQLGFRVRLTGLNSALISDAGDKVGQLLISEFQTAKLSDTPGVINVVMSHHPPDWLMDKAEIRQTLRRFAPVALFGHEHSARVYPDEKQIQLFAGALQPERDAPSWKPTYHVLQIGVEGTRDKPILLVRAYTREFHNFSFREWRDEDGNAICERRFPLQPWPEPKESAEMIPPKSAQPVLSSGVAMSEAKPTKLSAVDAKRQLRVHFFQLATPKRYEAANKAGLLRNGDDALDPQVMWAEVFKRAEAENRLAEFWAAVADHTPNIREIPNPFK